MKHPLRFLLVMLLGLGLHAQASQLKSPNGRIVVDITVAQKLYYSVALDGATLLKASPLSLTLGDGTVLGRRAEVKETKATSHKGAIALPWGRRAVVNEVYNQVELVCAGGYSVVFRAYDDGVAYRFRTTREGELVVSGEEVQWNLPSMDVAVWGTDYNTLTSSFEGIYGRRAYGDLKDDGFSYAPVLVEYPTGARVVITDSDVRDYPGLYVMREAKTGRAELKGHFAAAAKKTVDGGWAKFNRVVTERHDYLARTNGTRDFPWRALVIADSDRALLDSELALKLGAPNALSDTAWITPGHAAWEWWNDWNVGGVDFRTGINNETYRHYIDFASENKLPYLVVDEGWSNQFDLAVPNPALDIKAVIDYAKTKNVKIILWMVWKTLVDEADTAYKRVADLGAAGLKVDFFDRDDQAAVASVEAIAAEAARHKLVVDFHGCRALAGLQRTYPNILNFEGVRGGEYNKFNKEGAPTPPYNLALPFTRGLVATMDYTPGGMRNVHPGEFAASNSNPQVMGTRGHQLAMFVVYDAPLQMLCDSPSAYRAAPDFLAFLRQIPVTWDDSVALAGRVGDHAAVARRSGQTWYVGCMSGAEARELDLDLSFLGEGEWKATLVGDTVNSDRLAADYRIQNFTTKAGARLPVKLAQGGGAVIKLERR
ncbi:glycoside hydrolase family 97 protein [Nibricoccus sp. IMCC34717]|uniref:glycoside hydrolase family 97 protein n=1 Tax=Nibricoccus sp. IMCC34717 TaxID=3034021 RepID=UPI00384A59E2